MAHRRFLAIGVTVALLAFPVLAQEPPSRPACAAVNDSGLPAALAGWLTRAPLAAAGAATDTGKAVLPVGKGVDAQLKHTGEVVFPVLPGKPGGSASFGGLYELHVAEAGDYQVSLGAGAWVEMVDGQTLVAASSHAHGPPCASLKKIVVFTLKPGRYVLEITGNGEATLPLMVTRVVS